MIETPAYAKMLFRLVRRYGVRVGEADPIDLATMVEVQAELDRALVVAVAGQIAAGYSWREVGEGLGITKEAAWQRFASQVQSANGSAPLRSA